MRQIFTISNNMYPNMTRRVMLAAISALLCVWMPINAQSYNAEGEPQPAKSQATFREANDQLRGTILNFDYDEDEVYIGLSGLYDIWSAYKGKPNSIVCQGDSVIIDCELHPAPGIDGPECLEATITLKHTPRGIYEFGLAVEGELPESLSLLSGTVPLYKINEGRIDGKVPAKLGKKLSIAGLLKAVSPYIFAPEMMATIMYLRSHSALSEYEVVRQDERNRFLSYSFGPEYMCMECKYWTRNDGEILLVMDFHDPTYQYGQKLRFFVFNRQEGTVREIETALAEKWPLPEVGAPNEYCYQVRYYFDGIVTLVPQTDGDSFDIVTLKFDGKIFK